MAASRQIAELITDRFIGHKVNLLRLDAGERRRVLRMLARLQRELDAKLAASDIDERSIFQQQRLKALFIAVKATIEQHYSKIADTHDEQMIELADIESAHTIKALNSTIGVPLLDVNVPKVVLRALAKDAIVQGLPAKRLVEPSKVESSSPLSKHDLSRGVCRRDVGAAIATRARDARTTFSGWHLSHVEPGS